AGPWTPLARSHAPAGAVLGPPPLVPEAGGPVPGVPGPPGRRRRGAAEPRRRRRRPPARGRPGGPARQLGVAAPPQPARDRRARAEQPARRRPLPPRRAPPVPRRR